MSNAWKVLEDHPVRQENAQPRTVLLWGPEFGVVMGIVHHWSDGQIITAAPGYHGAKFTHWRPMPRGPRK